MRLQVVPAEQAESSGDLLHGTSVSTLLGLLLERQGWANWSRFRAEFTVAASRVAERTGGERFRTVTVSNSTYLRWMAGDCLPQGNARVVLEEMMGVSISLLFSPAPARDVVVPRPARMSSHAAVLALDTQWAWSSLSPTPPAPGMDGVWRLDGSPAFDGTTVAAQLYDAVPSGDLAVLHHEDAAHIAQFVGPARRGLVLAGLHQEGRAVLHALDTVHARRQIATGSPWRTMSVPTAYELDDLTCSILWAAVCLDDALLADDHVLTEAETELGPHVSAPRSALGIAALTDLSQSSAAWLGGWGCARHLSGHLEHTMGPARLWAPVRRWEEAAMRVLFRHQSAHVQSLRGRAEGIGVSLAQPLGEGPLHERIWLFLLVAWWESQGLTVWLSPQSPYTDMPGLMLFPGRRAVLADWGQPGMLCRVDATDSRAEVGAYGDAVEYSRFHGALGDAAPGDRLRALADILHLNWRWLTRRCRELGAYGTAGLVRPRSRRIGLDALDTALRTTGALAGA
ncbi:hypothetical protein ACIRQP_40530 [Streptomyces sp. NPDC102274]|uniref:hypothetical protein n=1 Tax=Streptomyces sp. NPDC102274 TaxID=3366151 RepID=UPI0037F57694